MATTFKVTEQLKNIAEEYKEEQEIDKPLKEYLNEIKNILRVMQADIEIIKRHTDLYQMSQPYVGVTTMAANNNEYIGGPVSKMPNDYYYTLYPDVSTKPLTDQEKKTALEPITEVETRTYCGPISKYCPDYLKGDYECK